MLLIFRRETHVREEKRKIKVGKLPTEKGFNISLNRVNVWEA
jgi:hypothetical protein